MSEAVSSCCAGKLYVTGDVTKHYECADCKKPCDAVINIIFSMKHEMSFQEKYEKLLVFAKKASRSCCTFCECIACDAVSTLKELGEWDSEKGKAK